MSEGGSDKPANSPGSAADATAATPPPMPLAGGSGGPTFRSGELVAGRYRILRFLAKGGMGEVYDAEDGTLGTRVALKTLRAETAADSDGLDRFKREMQLARLVTHPNVCRLFDFGFHGPIAFLTMELLEGETLTQRLRRDGRLSTEEARPLLEQMAAGLHAAHQAGVVHRDFKSPNVLLVPRTGGGLRAVVTDFGIARSAVASPGMPALTGTGVGMIGTPAYMAPEQVVGGEVTAATDIYALGLVMYEMVTGVLPFSGDAPLAVAARRLRESPAPPSSRVPGLDPRWESAILRCLEQDPAKRFASAPDVVDSLAVRPATTTNAGMRVRTAAFVVIALVTAILLLAWPWERGARPREIGGSRSSVAVVGFRNLGRPDSAWVSTALSEMLVAHLSANSEIRMIPGESVARARSDLALPEVDNYERATLDRISRLIGADFLVTGSHLLAGGKVVFVVRMQKVASGEIVASNTWEGEDSALLDLAGKGAEIVRAKLRLRAPTVEENAGVKAAIPRDPEAARLYAEGLDRMRVFDILGARTQLTSAAEKEPGSPVIHAELAHVWTLSGSESEARREAQKAFELSADLLPEDKLRVEARFRMANFQWDEAIAIYRKIVAGHLDDLETNLLLLEALTVRGDFPATLAVVDVLRKLPAPLSQDPRIDYQEFLAALSIGDAARTAAAKVRLYAKAETLGTRSLVAHANYQEGFGNWIGGDLPASLQMAKESDALFSALANENGRGQARMLTAIASMSQGDFETSGRASAEALQIARRIGNSDTEGGALMVTGMVALAAGNLDAARENQEAALGVWRRACLHYCTAFVEIELAKVALEQHRFSDAEAHARTAIELLRRHHFPIPEAGAHAALALSLLHQGKLDEARTAIEDGQRAVPAGEHYGLDLAIAAGRVRAASGTAADREAANTILQKTIARAEAAGFAHHGIEARIAQAEIHLRQGDSAAAGALGVLEKEARARRYLLLARHASEIH